MYSSTYYLYEYTQSKYYFENKYIDLPMYNNTHTYHDKISQFI